MNERLNVIAASALLALGFGATAQTEVTAYTSSDYTTTSTSEDVTLSCKGLYAESTTDGEIKGTCNQQDGEELKLNNTAIDLDGLLGCDGTSSSLSWSKTNLSSNATGISVGLDSTGKKYVLWAQCYDQPSDTTTAASTEIGSGVKNGSGSFAKK